MGEEKKQKGGSQKTFYDSPKIEEIVDAVIVVERDSCIIGPELVKQLRERASANDYVAKLTLDTLSLKYGEVAKHVDKCFLRTQIDGKTYGIVFGRAIISAIKCALGLAGKDWDPPFIVLNMLIPEEKITCRSSVEITKQNTRTVFTYELALPGEYPVRIVVTRRDEWEKLKPVLNGLLFLMGQKKKEGYGLCRLVIR